MKTGFPAFAAAAAILLAGCSEPLPEPTEVTAGGLKIVTYARRVNLPDNPVTTVGYVMPVDAAGKPRPGAENLVFYAPFTGEHKRKPAAQGWQTKFAAATGCTLVSLTIAVPKGESPDYPEPDSGWYEVVLEVQREIGQRYNFPHKKLFLLGQSSGCRMAEGLAVTYPDRIAAAAWTGGGHYFPLTPEARRIPMLALANWGDSGEDSSRAFAEEAQKAGFPVLFATMPVDPKLPNFDHHSPNMIIPFELMQSFVIALVKLRDANGGEIPPPDRWPVAWEYGPFRARLPSEEFAARWRQLPWELYAARTGPARLLREYTTGPGCAATVGLVIADGSNTFPLSWDILFYLRESGVKPVLADLAADPAFNAGAALDAVLAREEWRDRRIVVWALGTTAPAAAAALAGRDDPRLTGFISCEYEWPEYPEPLRRLADRKLPVRLYRPHPGLAAPPAPPPGVETVNPPAKPVNNLTWHARIAADLKAAGAAQADSAK